MAPRYSYRGLPRTLFGLTSSQHRAHKLRILYKHYGVYRARGSTKETLLRSIPDFKQTLTVEEIAAITEWFQGLRDSLDPPTEIPPSLYTNEIQPLIGSRRRLVPGASTSDTFSTYIAEVDECSVCMGDVTQPGSVPFVSPKCEHVPTVCEDCVREHIHVQVRDLAWDSITCPSCPVVLGHDSVKRYASPKTFQAFDRNSVLAALSNMENFTMCLGPGCGSGQIHGGGDDQPIMTCTSCNFRTCFTHKMPHHEGLSCKEYDVAQKKRAKEEAASAKLLAKTTKVCPNKRCASIVTKVSGCNHMTCHRWATPHILSPAPITPTISNNALHYILNLR
ncbi:ring finger [Phlyctema vagabunda]|uniref:RBR-type E3 ubiquitin transferase n=1 Tax=Phlyctema vagabunda TaxID=108571 RepID=A0ABR4PQ30_9HELO